MNHWKTGTSERRLNLGRTGSLMIILLQKLTNIQLCNNEIIQNHIGILWYQLQNTLNGLVVGIIGLWIPRP